MVVLAAVGMFGMTSAQAQVTFTGSGTAPGDGEAVAASASFNNVGGHLVLTLINTYTGSTFGNADTLYGAFFNGASGLTVASVQETVGDLVYNPPSTTPATITTLTSISNWQMDTLGGQSGIDGTQGGPENGLVSQGFSTAGGYHDGIASGSHNPYVSDELLITFDQSLSLSSINNVNFLYGTTVSTDFTVPGQPVPVPEASTAAAGALMLLPLAVGMVRALRKEKALVPVKIS